MSNEKPKTSDTTYEEFRDRHVRDIADDIIVKGFGSIRYAISRLVIEHSAIIREGGFKKEN